jgi:hypothetical protein
MGKIGFGTEHLNMPTPASISRAVTIISVVLPAFMLWINSDDNLFTERATHIITSLGSLFTLLSNAAGPFFGVRIDTPLVPTDKVTAIEDKPNA